MPELGELQQILSALVASRARFLVVGGVAMVLHGHPRFTADLDLILALGDQDLKAALNALKTLQYRPRPPVSLEDFADPATRTRWLDEKNLTVLSLWSPLLPTTDVDLFVDQPLDFEAAWARATFAALGFAKVPVASIEDMLTLKTLAGRNKDLEDLQALRRLQDQATRSS